MRFVEYYSISNLINISNFRIVFQFLQSKNWTSSRSKFIPQQTMSKYSCALKKCTGLSFQDTRVRTSLSCTLISLINVESTLTDFEKFHPPCLLISLLKCLVLLQNLMMIFLTVILSYKTLF